MFEEFLKMFIACKACANFSLLRQYDLFRYLFPSLEQLLQQNTHPYAANFIALAMENTDKRILAEQRVTPAFLFAALLWYPMQLRIERLKTETQLTPQDIFFAALNEIMPEQQRSIAIPKRFQAVIKDIWILQEKFERREGKRAFTSLAHQKFRAGYDFLLLRGEIEGGEVAELAQWWTDFQEVSEDARMQMIKSLPQKKNTRRTARKRSKPQAKTNNA